MTSVEARVTISRLHQLASAMESYEDDQDEYPDVSSVDELVAALEPRYGTSLPTMDGWGRPFEVAMVRGFLEIRSLGADGVRDTGEPRGEVDDLESDIVFSGEEFRQWPASRS